MPSRATETENSPWCFTLRLCGPPTVVRRVCASQLSRGDRPATGCIHAPPGGPAGIRGAARLRPHLAERASLRCLGRTAAITSNLAGGLEPAHPAYSAGDVDQRAWHAPSVERRRGDRDARPDVRRTRRLRRRPWQRSVRLRSVRRRLQPGPGAYARGTGGCAEGVVRRTGGSLGSAFPGTVGARLATTRAASPSTGVVFVFEQSGAF